MSTAPISRSDRSGLLPSDPTTAPVPALHADISAPIRPPRQRTDSPRAPLRRSNINDDDIGQTEADEEVEGNEDIAGLTARPLPASYVRAMAREALGLKHLADWLARQTLTPDTKASALAVVKDLALAHALVCAMHISDIPGLSDD
jgi:hypothetical protein